MNKVAFLAVFAIAAYNPTDADRARWTMSDMMSWRIAIQAYATDHGSYPNVKTLEALRDAVQPMYIASAPMVDAWGNPYRYESESATQFRLISSGADGKFDPSSWATPARGLAFDGDAVVSNEGKWLARAWDLSGMSDADRAQKSELAIRAIKTAVEGYAHVHNQWPQANSMEQLRALVQPDFIRNLPMVDAWGTPFVYELDANGYQVKSSNLERKAGR